MFTVKNAVLCVCVCVDAVKRERGLPLPPLSVRTANQKLEAAILYWLNYHVQNIFTPLPIRPLWQPYLLASKAEGRIMEGYKWEEAYLESLAGTSTPEKREYELFQEGDHLYFTAINGFDSGMLHVKF